MNNLKIEKITNSYSKHLVKFYEEIGYIQYIWLKIIQYVHDYKREKVLQVI